MFEPQEGSILDPYAFMPKPKKPQQVKRAKPVKVDFAPLIRNASKAKSGAFGLIKEYQRIHSPQYQLNKAKREMRDIELRKQVMQKRRELEAMKAAERAEKYESMRRKIIEAKKSISSALSTSKYGFSTSKTNLPRYNADNSSASEEAKERFVQNKAKLYLTDKEKYEKK